MIEYPNVYSCSDFKVPNCEVEKLRSQIKECMLTFPMVANSDLKMTRVSNCKN